jgi:Ca2+-binding EF-hand superfamily protein
VAVLGWTAWAGAQDAPRRPVRQPPAKPVQRLAQLDANGDGVLERSEVPQRMKERFEQIDRDGDGKLTRQELAQASQRGAGARRPDRSAPANPLLRLLDADRDGELSSQEIAAAPQALSTLDKNRDGNVDRQELSAILPSSRGGRPGEVITPAAKGERHDDKLEVGDVAPDFTLPLVSGGGEVTLSAFQAKRPVVLIFASYT